MVWDSLRTFLGFPWDVLGFAWGPLDIVPTEGSLGMSSECPRALSGFIRGLSEDILGCS